MANDAVKMQPDIEQSGGGKAAHPGAGALVSLAVQGEQGSWKHYSSCKKTGWLLINPNAAVEMSNLMVTGLQKTERVEVQNKPLQITTV